jgi:hypothetical protein
MCQVCAFGSKATMPLIRVSVTWSGSLSAPAPELSTFAQSASAMRWREGGFAKK